MVGCSIIIPTYNGANKILKILKALESQSYKDFETIVVIDGSTDNTRQRIESKNWELKSLRIIEQPNKGRATVRNTGAKVAVGELLVFFDDDMRPRSNCIELHTQFYNNSDKRSIVVGSVPEDKKLLKSDIQEYRYHLSEKWCEPLKNINGPLNRNNLFITAANFSIPKEIFSELNGFDETLNDAEDFDLAVRAYLKKIHIFYQASIIAWHDDFITCRSYIKRLREYNVAQKVLRTKKPELYKEFTRYNPTVVKGPKNIIYSFFSNNFWVQAIESEKMKFLPIAIRYKIYDLVITSLSTYFPDKLI